MQQETVMRALSDTNISELVDSPTELDLGTEERLARPYRSLIWLGVFAAGGVFWFAVGLGIHALLH
jgi:hypothetical protein